MDKVTVRMVGGLGNFMFQISAAYAYACKYNKELVISNQNSFIVHRPLSSYSNNILKEIEIQQYISNLGDYHRYVEPSFAYKELPYIEGNVILDGFFQSEKYFKDYEEEIKNLFNYTRTPIKGLAQTPEVSGKNTCSIHVRRGDFLHKQSHHPIQTLEYYLEAMSFFSKDTIFLISSDDHQWCTKTFTPDKGSFLFVEPINDYNDISIMSLCDNNIIANSTFSWWGAWLNPSETKTVIAPKQWFGVGYAGTNTEDIYCPYWIKI